MSDLASEMESRGMFDLKFRQDKHSLIVRTPKGKIKSYGDVIKIVRKKDNGEWEIYKSEPDVYLDCGDRYVPGEPNSGFCDCGRHCCKSCLRHCQVCLKIRICRRCQEIFRIKAKNGQEEVLYLCDKCFRKKKREKIIRFIMRIFLFPYYFIALFLRREK